MTQSNLDPGWLAVAQVYATLAAAAASAGAAFEGNYSNEREAYRRKSSAFVRQAEQALRAAGVEG